MAKKISDLVGKADLNNADSFVLSDAVAGADRRITVENLKDIFAERNYVNDEVSFSTGKLFPSSRNQGKGEKAVISFCFDDGYDIAATTIKDLFATYGWACGFAINSRKTSGATGRATLSQFFKAQQEGFEILNHTATAYTIQSSTIPDERVDAEINGGYTDLVEQGFKIKGFVANQSALTDDYIPLLKQKHVYGFTVFNSTHGSTALIKGDFDRFKLYRLSTFSASLQECKDTVDAAIAEKGWICFYDHEPGGSNFVNSASVQKITDLLDYINSKGDTVDVLTPGKAVDALHNATLQENEIEKLGSINSSSNLINDNTFVDIGNSLADNWLVDQSLITGTVDYEVIESNAFGRLDLTFNDDFVAGDIGSSFVLKNDKLKIPINKFLISIHTFAMWLETPNVDINDYLDFSVGIQVKKQSDNSTLFSSETSATTITTRALPLWISNDIGRFSSQDVYVNLFLRARVKNTFPSARKVIVYNPSIASGYRNFPNFEPKKVQRSFEGNIVSTDVPTESRTALNIPSSNLSWLNTDGGATITAKRSGLYNFNVIIRDATNHSGTRSILSLTINGGADGHQSEGIGTASVLVCQLCASVYLNKGDTVQVRLFQDSGSTISIDEGEYANINISFSN